MVGVEVIGVEMVGVEVVGSVGAGVEVVGVVSGRGGSVGKGRGEGECSRVTRTENGKKEKDRGGLRKKSGTWYQELMKWGDGRFYHEKKRLKIKKQDLETT